MWEIKCKKMANGKMETEKKKIRGEKRKGEMKTYHVRDWHIYISLELPVIELCSLNHHEMGGEVDPPGYCSCSNKNLDLHANI